MQPEPTGRYCEMGDKTFDDPPSQASNSMFYGYY
jgi:hypothetical protein